MAEIRITNLHKAFGDFAAVRDSTFTVNDGEFLLPARSLGLWQDHDVAHDRRIGIAYSPAKSVLGGDDVTLQARL